MPTEVASIEVTLRLLGSERFQAGMRESGSVSEQTGARVKRAMDGIASSTDRVSAASLGLTRTDRALQAISGSAVRAEISVSGLTRGVGLLQAAVAGLAGGAAANAFKNYADTATNIQNRLAAVIPVQAQRAAIDQQIFDTAQKTRTSYEATANIFSRMSLSASTLGASQSEILRAVEITQKALVSGGATTAESASIATQLSQALGSGKLAGDELKSIAENSPVLIQAIAREFGVAVGALKDMGAAGELTSARVFKAILNAGKEVDDVFARTTPTIAAGIQQIDNALTRYIGNVDKSVGATKALTGGLEYVANNISNIGDAAILAVGALGGALLGRGTSRGALKLAEPFVEAKRQATEAAKAAREAVVAQRGREAAAELNVQRQQALFDIARGTPSMALAGGKPMADLEASERSLRNARAALAAETEKLAKAEEHRDATAAKAIQASRAVMNAEARAQSTLSGRRDDLRAQLLAYRDTVTEAMTAEASLPKRSQERYEAALSRRAQLQQELTSADYRAAGLQADLDGVPESRVGPRSRAKAERAAALTEELDSLKARRNEVGRALREVEQAYHTGEEALARSNLAARSKAADAAERIGERLVAAERTVVDQKQVVEQRAAAVTGYDGTGRAQSPAAVLKQIEAEISAQEKLFELTRKRDALSGEYLDAMARAPQASGSLSAPDVRALNQARDARAALMRELEAADREIAAKSASLDQLNAGLGPRVRQNLGREADDAGRRSEINAALEAATAQRATLASDLERTNGIIAASEQELAERTAKARRDMLGQAQVAGERLRAVQAQIGQDLATLAERRKAVITAEMTNEQERATKLAAIDAQVAARRAQQKDLQTAIGFNEIGVEKARAAVEADAAGRRTEAQAATTAAVNALQAQQKVTAELEASAQKAARMATVVGAMGNVARTAVGAFSGLVGMLGGPLGAAVTAASVAWVGYELYQARATEAVERHTEALGKLATRRTELTKATEAGQVRTISEKLTDDVLTRDATRGVRDRRDRVLNAVTSAEGEAARQSYVFGDDGSLSAQALSPLDQAAERLGFNLGAITKDARELAPASEESVAASAKLAAVLEELARVDPRYRDKAIEARAAAKAQAEAAETARQAYTTFKEAEALTRATGGRQAVYDGEGLGPLTRAPRIAAEETKAQIKQVEDYAKSVGASLIEIGGQSYNFPELTLLREQLQGAVKDIATVRAEAPGLLSGFSVPPALLEVVQAFSRGQESAEGYAQRLRELREANPNFAPLIDSLLKANEVALKASAQIDSVGARVDALDGKSAEVNIVVKTTSLAAVKVADAKEVEDQTAAAEKAITDLQAKTYNLQLRAKGETARAKAIELQGSNPGLDIRAATEEIRKQEALEERIAALGRKGRGGGGRKSPEQRSADTLAKKLEELDQDASVAALNDFDQKTVRFAQSAKVASDQIQAFIAAAKSGDMSSVPPVMQEIYDKMRQLEGVKLGKAALDELFPGRLLAEQIESVRRAAAHSPEIAANLDLIIGRMRAAAAPDWAKSAAGSISNFAESAITDFDNIGQAADALMQELVKIALRAAILKPLEQSIEGFFGGMGGSSGGGFGGLLSSIAGAITGGGGDSPTGGVRLFADGVTAIGDPDELPRGVRESSGRIQGPGTGTSDDVPAIGPGGGPIRVSNGESIVTAKATAENMPLIRALNEGAKPQALEQIIRQRTMRGHPLALPELKQRVGPELLSSLRNVPAFAKGMLPDVAGASFSANLRAAETVLPTRPGTSDIVVQL